MTSFPAGSAGAGIFEPLQVVIFKAGRGQDEQLCAGRVIAMRADTATVLIAIPPSESSTPSQRLFAGHVGFVPVVKGVGELSVSLADAQAQHGRLPTSAQTTLEDFVPSAALAAYHGAVDAGFVSATSSGGPERFAAEPPALSTSSFVDLGVIAGDGPPAQALMPFPGPAPPPLAAGAASGPQPASSSPTVQEQVQLMLAQQAELASRISAAIEPTGAGQRYSPLRGAPGMRGSSRAGLTQNVSFDPAAGTAGMQAAAVTLSGASGWGCGGQSPRPSGGASSLASTVVPQGGFMGDGEDADMSSGESAPVTGPQASALPPLLAQGSQRRSERRLRRQQHALSFGSPTGLQGFAPTQGHGLQPPGPPAPGFNQQFMGAQGTQMYHLGSGAWAQQAPPAATWADSRAAHAQMPAFAPGFAAGQSPPMGLGYQANPGPQGGMQHSGHQAGGHRHGGGGAYQYGPRGGAPLDPQAALTLEMARQLQRLRHRRGGNSGSGSSSSAGGNSSGRSDGHSIPSKLKAVLRLRSRVQRHPMRILTRYRAKCLQRLGIYALPNGMLSAPYTHPQTSLHIRSAFGRMTGLWRCHFMLSHILEKLEQGQTEQAAATCVQALKAVHQTALDGGSWNCSTLLLPYEDPLARDLFGGDEDEMMATAAWNRGVRDLQSQVASLSHNSGGHQEAEEGPGQHTAATRADRRTAAAKGKAKAAAAAAAAAAGAGASRP